MSAGSDAHRDLKRAIQREVGQLPYARCFLRETGQGVVGGRRTSLWDNRKQRQVTAWIGGSVVRFGVVSGADLVAVVAPLGRHVELEVKTGSASPSKKQRMFGVAIEKFGAVYRVVRSVEEALAIVSAVNAADKKLLARQP